MRILLLSLFCFVALNTLSASAGDITVTSTTSLHFASKAEGVELLTTVDDFVRRMSNFDRAARLKTDKPVTQEAYLNFVATHVLSWTPETQQRIESALAPVRARLELMRLPLPSVINIVLTTGAEEGHAAYTRGTTIVLPMDMLEGEESLRAILCHELFHVLTRNAPTLRNSLYAIIGFVPCGEVVHPTSLTDRRITNPDAPTNEHAIKVTIDNNPQWVVPILYATAPYDVQKGGEFFEYLAVGLLVVNTSTVGNQPTSSYASVPPIMPLNQVQGYFEQIGQNTGYIIHPEEILADNFAMLVQNKTDVKSPHILKSMQTVLGF